MSDRPAPPTTARVVWLVVALGARRLWNARFAGSVKAKSGAQTKRGATPGKSGGRAAVVAFALLAIGFQAYRVASTVVVQASPVTMLSVTLDAQVDAPRTADSTTRRSRHRSASPAAFLPSASQWPEARARRPLFDLLAAIATAFTVLLVLFGLGIDREDLGKADGMLETLYQTPISARTLHLALIVRRATVNFILWGLVLPFWVGVGVCAGYGYFSLPIAFAATIYLGFISGAVQVVVETLARLLLRPHTIRNVQAVASIVGSLAYAGLMLSGSAIARQGAWSHLFTLPDWVRWTPTAIVAALFDADVAAPASIGMVVSAAVLVVAALAMVERLLARGLVTASGGFVGARGRSTSRAWARSGLGGRLGVVAGKDVRLLLRDRNLFAQALVTPLFIVGMQISSGRGLLTSMHGGLAGASAAAFFFAAYGYAFGAANILTFEGPALWMLFSLPRPIDRVLMDKVTLWMLIGCTIAAIALVGLGGQASLSTISPMDGLRVATMLCGVMLYAFVGAGIGVLATDPTSPIPARRQQPSTLMLYLALVGGFTRTVYGDGVWDKLVALMLTTVLALALWQKVRDRLPYLLDPTEAPPPSIAISDAVLAAIAYFFLQTVFALLGLAAEMKLEAAVTVASAASASIVAAVSLSVFRAAKVPNLLATIGLRRLRGVSAGRVPWPFVGAALGLAAGIVAIGYTQLCLRIEPIRAYIEESQGDSPLKIDNAWMIVFAVVVAPIAEELIFRGLLFRSLRRSWAALPAALASAALFAVCHPPLSIAPVFIVGVATALAIETTGLLWTSIVVHMTYNAIVVAASLR